jgi:antitoxin component of RelBE/YafQ-DinJ toxin-antitoxin module
MIKKTRIVITVDKSLAEESKRVLNELGMKRSTFLNVILQALVDSETKPMKQIYSKIYDPLFDEMAANVEKKKKKKRKKK